jgi:hypothetical protein
LVENRTLRQKRDIVCSKLVDRLPQIFEAAGEECPSFEFRDQGSYQMQTGTFPLNGDFDIDLGMYFEIDPDDYHPLELKRMVFKTLEGHTREVRIRRPCVTVQYQQAGEPTYHVDIAIYSDGSQSGDGMPRLAIGKGRSGEKFCGWEVSDPLTLSSEILESYEGVELTRSAPGHRPHRCVSPALRCRILPGRYTGRRDSSDSRRKGNHGELHFA